jgi:DNA-binding LacI/PurR family transcriptional regulator
MAALERLMKTSPRPSAIIAPHDLLARDIILMLRQIGFKVPNDVSVMGHNDLEAVSFFEPGITTMRIPRFEMGRAAVATLLKTIEKEKTESTYFDCELLIRSSCAPFQKKGKR